MNLFKKARNLAGFLSVFFVSLGFSQTSQIYEAENATLQNGPAIVANSSASGGNEVYINNSGQVTWTVQITRARNYLLEFQFRSPSGDKKQKLFINGIEQEIIFPNFSSFSQVQVSKYLSVGSHSIQISRDWGLVYLDYLKVISPEITTDDLTRVECENATLLNCSAVTDGSYSGGRGVRFVTAGQITMQFSVPSAGYYGINIGYNAQYGEKNQTLSINGVSSQVLFKASTGRTTLTMPVQLNSGNNTLVIAASWGWIDLDYVELIPGKVDNLNPFVKVNGMQFMLNNTKYTFLGTNAWHYMNLGATTSSGDRARLVRELDHLVSLGIRNIRLQAATEGPNSEPIRAKPSLQVSPGVLDISVLNGLDFVLDEMGKRNMKAVLCLNNFWEWSGGFGQYLVWAREATSIPYPPPLNGDFDTYQNFVSRFYGSAQSQVLYKDFIKQLMSHKNYINGKVYKLDPVIMAWELANEPRAMSYTTNFYNWVNSTSTYIKSLDAFHLVTVGMEGDTPHPTYSNTDYYTDHNFPNIDYGTMHIWPENFGWLSATNQSGTYNTAINNTYSYISTHITKTRSLQKPLVLEEFGLGRDGGSYDYAAGTYWRDRYYRDVFERVFSLNRNGDPIQGVSFWTWSGEGRPRSRTGSLWQVGDNLIGDPAHELQGWYGVYNVDNNTRNLISEYTAKINSSNGTTYTLTTSAANGTITLNPAGGSYTAGTVVTATASSPCNTFVSWSGASTSTSNPVTITMDGNKTLTANFTQNTFSVNASAGTNGTITPTSTTSLTCGSNLTLTITPSAGYTIDRLLDNNTPVSVTGNSYTINNITANHNVSVSFKINVGLTKETIVSAAASSIETGHPAANAIDGNTTTTRWSSAYSDPQWIAFDLGSSKAITTFVFDWETANARNYTLEGSNDVNFTTKATLASRSNMAAINHRIDSLTGLTGSYRYYRMYGTARNGTWGYSIWEARCYSSGAPVTYTISTSAGANGTITPSGTTTVSAGANQIITVTPSNGFVIDRLLDNGVSVTVTNNSYTISNVSTNHTVSATFKLPTTQYTLTTNTINGSITLSPAGGIYDAGTVVTATANTSSCYTFISWSGASTSTSSPVSITMDGNKSLTANFAQKTFSVTASAGANGTITPVSSPSVVCGSNLTLTISPATGYVIDQLLDNGAVVTATNNSYTISNVIANHSVSVSFKLSGPVLVTGITAVASSEEIDGGTTRRASYAIDGNTATRWSSAYSDPQWIRFDLGSAKSITSVVFDWETANARNYTLEASNDINFTTKTTLATRTNMAATNHRIDILPNLTGSYRYYRMYGTARNGTWGYSIWETRFYTGGNGN
jgi:mannan endo-1,4-beta-mannosidase